MLAAVVLAVLYFTNRPPSADRLPDEAAARLQQLQTIKGRLLLGKDDQALEYELWVQRPRHLRAETELKGLDRKAVFLLVFNDEEAWTYDLLLNIATVTDRSKGPPAKGARFGTSLLETLPDDVLAALRAADIHIIGEEEAAGRNALRVQMLPSAQNPLAEVGQAVLSRRYLLRCTHPPAQGLISSILIPSKSSTSLVATDAPRQRAMAAIWQSAWLMGRPAARRAAATTA